MPKNWSKTFKKNWKIWLLSLLMVLILVARGLGSLTRSYSQTAASPQSGPITATLTSANK